MPPDADAASDPSELQEVEADENDFGNESLPVLRMDEEVYQRVVEWLELVELARRHSGLMMDVAPNIVWADKD